MAETEKRPAYEAENMTAEQRAAVKNLSAKTDAAMAVGEERFDCLDELLWDVLNLFAEQPFLTAKKLEFTYSIKGNEMFVTRKEKSITRATVNIAFHKALELGGVVTGPKKLGTFGASYLYPVFIRIGVIRETKK